MTGFIRLVLLVGLAYLIVAGVRRLAAAASGRGPSGAADGSETGSVPLVQDPHCGRFIPQTEALVVSRRGRTFYFCSPECRRAYRMA